MRLSVSWVKSTEALLSLAVKTCGDYNNFMLFLEITFNTCIV